MGEVVLVWGDPRLEGVGLGFGSSLPVLPGVGAMLRLTPSLRPPPPQAHPLLPPLSSHLQRAVSTPWGHWLLCKEVPAGCRDKKARG